MPFVEEVGHAKDPFLAQLDRVDFFRAVYGMIEVPQTAALIESACALVGEVFRDAEVLRTWLGATQPGSWERGAGVVALGLLGECSAQIPGDRADLTARLLSLETGLTVTTDHGTVRSMGGAGREAAERRAVDRVRAGFLLSAVE